MVVADRLRRTYVGAVRYALSLADAFAYRLSHRLADTLSFGNTAAEVMASSQIFAGTVRNRLILSDIVAGTEVRAYTFANTEAFSDRLPLADGLICS